MILSNDTGRVIQHTGAIFETPASTSDDTDAVETVRRSDPEDHSDPKDAVAPINGHDTLPMVNATVRKYADAVRRIVAATKDAVHGIDEKVSTCICYIRAYAC